MIWQRAIEFSDIRSAVKRHMNVLKGKTLKKEVVSVEKGVNYEYAGVDKTRNYR